MVRFYNKRGRADQWIREGKQAVKMTRLGCHFFRSNEVLERPWSKADLEPRTGAGSIYGNSG